MTIEVLSYAFGLGAVVGFLLFFWIMPNTYFKRSDWKDEAKLTRDNVDTISKMTGDFLKKEEALAKEIEQKRIEINELIEHANAYMAKIKNEIEEMFK